MRSPGPNEAFTPPAAFDTKSVRAPSACATRTGSAAVSAE
jgi:hypothetical protein